MSQKQFITHAPGWGWKEDVPFASAVAAGDLVFIGGQQSLDGGGALLGAGDIAAQTRNVFENMKATLARAGLELADLARINTYYIFDGDEADATRFWEDMTRVRLEYFPDPGPVGTAVRVKGMPYAGQLIQIEGIALKGEARRGRRRIMPAGSWDWSIPLPLSQGWRAGQRIFVGGQISAEGAAITVAPGDVRTQTRNVYGFIQNVVEDAGASLDDIVHVKICFKHEAGDDTANQGLSHILDITTATFREPGPAVTAFGVDLLYPGLVLEIDAMAVIDGARQAIRIEDLGGRYQPPLFADGIGAGGEIHTGGQVALGADGAAMGPGDIEREAAIVFERLGKILAAAGASFGDVVKLNLFLVGETGIEEAFHRVARVWAAHAPGAQPEMTPVRVHELAVPCLLVQADAVAIT